MPDCALKRVTRPKNYERHRGIERRSREPAVSRSTCGRRLCLRLLVSVRCIFSGIGRVSAPCGHVTAPCAGCISVLMTRNFNIDTRMARAADRSRRRRRQVNDTPAHIRTAIIDPNDNRATALSIRDPHQRSEWKRLVRGRHCAWSSKFPIGGSAALIDRGDADLRASGGQCRNADKRNERSGNNQMCKFFHEDIPLLSLLRGRHLRDNPSGLPMLDRAVTVARDTACGLLVTWGPHHTLSRMHRRQPEASANVRVAGSGKMSRELNRR